VTRAIALGVLLASLGGAPLQCGSGHEDPALRMNDSPGDALWALAMDFRAKGNEEAARQTMRFLVEKYPSNRHVTEAKFELEGGANGASAAGAAGAATGASSATSATSATGGASGTK
jgi:hypothetical protein